MSSGITLSEIWVYPIKSLAGIRVKSWEVLPKGLKHDRRFMLIDSKRIAMTQREYPQLALFKCLIKHNVLEVTYKQETLEIDLLPENFEQDLKAIIWDDTVDVKEIRVEYSNWFTKQVGTECKLVFFPEDHDRPVDPQFQIAEEHVSLADAYPLLLIGQESLNDLNRKLSSPVKMDRFRPNLVFTGGDAYEEDLWTSFTVGDNRFAAVKQCARCVMTTVDQNTGIKGSEPLKTLASYRTKNNKVYFGQNVLVVAGSIVQEGDKILATKKAIAQ
jgi:uncharacterized protein